jgi:hypothetical protein
MSVRARLLWDLCDIKPRAEQQAGAERVDQSSVGGIQITNAHEQQFAPSRAHHCASLLCLPALLLGKRWQLACHSPTITRHKIATGRC